MSEPKLGPMPGQDAWQKMIDLCGDEQAATEHVVFVLRSIANILESGCSEEGYPRYVFGIGDNFPKPGAKIGNNLLGMDSVTVTITGLWPG